MITPDSSANESRRISDLHSYCILDTPADETFDDVTRLAAHVCSTPISLISLVDIDRIWFKSSVGLSTRQIPRTSGFCASAILGPGLLLIPDATTDVLCASHPLVLLEPKLRFYAGAPLTTPRGNRIGTLCVIDSIARGLSANQVAILESLARIVVSQLELGRAVRMQEETHQTLSALQSQTEKQVQQRTEQLASSADSLRKLTAQLLRAQDEERRRIARGLHDSTGQVLAALSMNITQMEKQSSELNVAKFKECRELIGSATIEIRNLSYLLHPPLMDELGLVSAVKEYALGFGARSGVAIKVDVEEDFGRLDNEREIALFRVIQESLGNVYRHSGSATASVKLYCLSADVVLEVCDQGRGLQTATGEPPKFGVGIRSMQERLREIGGTLQIESMARGTKVIAVLPKVDLRGVAPGEISFSAAPHGLTMQQQATP